MINALSPQQKTPIYTLLGYNSILVKRWRAHSKGLTMIRIMGEGDDSLRGNEETFQGIEIQEDAEEEDLDFFPTTLMTASLDQTIKLWGPEAEFYGEITLT